MWFKASSWRPLQGPKLRFLVALHRHPLALQHHGRVSHDVDEAGVVMGSTESLLPPVGEEERYRDGEPVQRPVLQAEQQRGAQGVDTEDAVQEHQVEAELHEVADHHVDVPLPARDPPAEALGPLELDCLGLAAFADELEQTLARHGNEDRVLLEDQQQLGEDRERDGIDHGVLRSERRLMEMTKSELARDNRRRTGTHRQTRRNILPEISTRVNV